jgi:long-subunit fatty acid transport protein
VAQFPEDALRFSSAGYGVGARALGMGNAYKAVANDFSALYWNPAGLAQAKLGEFSFGLSQLYTGNTSTFFGQNESSNNNGTALNSLGFVFPAPVRRGALVLALGFTRRSNFTSGLSFSGFNPISSIIQTWAPDGQPYPKDASLAEELNLAQADALTGRYRSPITKNVTQLGTVIEERGLNNWSAGGALDIAKNVSVGITLTYVSGSYRYDRAYQEQDNRRLYPYPFDFRDVTVDEFIESDITGVNALFGLMYRDPDHFRIALTVATPTSFTVQERFGTSASSAFYTADSSGNSTYKPPEQEDRGEYDIRSPWVLGAGASVILGDLLLSADVETADWTTLEFANANKDVLARNKEMKTLFRSVFNYRAGAEYEIPGIGVRLRGGYSFEQSPFAGDPASFDKKFFHAGLGIPLAPSTMIDVGFSHGWWRTYRTNYDATSRVDEKLTTNYFLATLTHRF